MDDDRSRTISLEEFMKAWRELGLVLSKEVGWYGGGTWTPSHGNRQKVGRRAVMGPLLIDDVYRMVTCCLGSLIMIIQAQSTMRSS